MTTNQSSSPGHPATRPRRHAAGDVPPDPGLAGHHQIGRLPRTRVLRDTLSAAGRTRTFSHDTQDGRSSDSAVVPESAIPADPVHGPKRCCAEYGTVIACDGKTDTWLCLVCEIRWTAPCPDTEIWQPEPVS